MLTYTTFDDIFDEVADYFLLQIVKNYSLEANYLNNFFSNYIRGITVTYSDGHSENYPLSTDRFNEIINTENIKDRLGTTKVFIYPYCDDALLEYTILSLNFADFGKDLEKLLYGLKTINFKKPEDIKEVKNLLVKISILLYPNGRCELNDDYILNFIEFSIFRSANVVSIF
jgi:hypothetical protein